MGEHTPGPWFNDKGLIYNADNDEVGVTPDWSDEDRALALAAPRMKAALEQAVTSMLDSGYSTDALVVRECQQALGDARGESND